MGRSLDADSSAALHVFAFSSVNRVLRQLLGGRVVPAEDQSSGGEHLLQKWTMRLAQVDGASHGCGHVVDQLDAGVGGERHGGTHGDVKVAVRLLASGDQRAHLQA